MDRRYAIRRLEGTPLYLTAGIENATIRSEWLATMGTHLIFGIPAALLLLMTLFAVLRRTQALYGKIDRRAAAESALRQSQKLEAIGQLTGGIAHDFNNLLTIIIGNLEGLQKQLAGADLKVRRRADNAMHGAQRAATLTKRLLAFSRHRILPVQPGDLARERVKVGIGIGVVPPDRVVCPRQVADGGVMNHEAEFLLGTIDRTPQLTLFR